MPAGGTAMGDMAYLLCLVLLTQGASLAAAHSGMGGAHEGCGHSLIAHESRRWSDGHRNSVAAAKAAGVDIGPPVSRQRQQQQQEQAQQQAQQQGQQQAQQDGRRLLQSSNGTLPIRIWVEFQGLSSLTSTQQTQLRDTVNIALGVLQKYLRVRRPVSGKLLVPALCERWDTAGYCNLYAPDLLDSSSANSASNKCGLAVINGSHIAAYQQCTLGGGSCQNYPGGAGEFTDYYLYITATQDEHCGTGAVAWALPCLYAPATNRPLLGSANVCPQNIVNKDSDSAVAVLVHELTHALGFTDDSFDKFIDADGVAIPKDQVVRNTKDAYGMSITLVTSPTVLKESRLQFNCDKLNGAPLENEGGAGSANAHWEYLYFQGELMVATNLFSVAGNPATMSRITLAFMQDTGWYDINWDAAGFLDWGYKAGCEFLTNTCTDYAAKYPSQNYFCNAQDRAPTTDGVCTYNSYSRAKCDSTQFAGSCLMKLAIGNTFNCLHAEYETSSGLHSSNNIFGWANTLTSRCMPVTWLFNTQPNNGYQYQFPDAAFKDGWQDSVCYNTSCDASNQLRLRILGEDVLCPSGQTVDLAKVLPGKFTQGSIGPCPDNAAVCATQTCPQSCALGGLCRSGKCYCGLTFTGSDCSNKLTPSGNYTKYVPPPPGTFTDDSANGTDSYLMITASISNTASELMSALDRYKQAIADLAGVTSGRVAVVSYTTSALAASLQDSSSSGASGLVDGADSGRSSSAGSGGSSSSSSSFGGSSSGQGRRLAQAGSVTVDSRVTTLSSSDAALITARVQNATRVAAFSNALAAAGLTYVPNSLAVRTPAEVAADGSSGSGVINLNDPNTLRIIIIVVSIVGAAILVALLAWLIRCCCRPRATPPHASPIVGDMGNGYGGGYGYSNGMNGYPASARPSYVDSTPVQPYRESRTSYANGSRQSFAQAYNNPPRMSALAQPARAASVSVQGPFVVADRTFHSAREADDYALALALSKSLSPSQMSPVSMSPTHTQGGGRPSHASTANAYNQQDRQSRAFARPGGHY